MSPQLCAMSLLLLPHQSDQFRSRLTVMLRVEKGAQVRNTSPKSVCREEYTHATVTTAQEILLCVMIDEKRIFLLPNLGYIN